MNDNDDIRTVEPKSVGPLRFAVVDAYAPLPTSVFTANLTGHLSAGLLAGAAMATWRMGPYVREARSARAARRDPSRFMVV